MKSYIGTVHILVNAENDEEARRIIETFMREHTRTIGAKFRDWEWDADAKDYFNVVREVDLAQGDEDYDIDDLIKSIGKGALR